MTFLYFKIFRTIVIYSTETAVYLLQFLPDLTILNFPAKENLLMQILLKFFLSVTFLCLGQLYPIKLAMSLNLTKRFHLSL